MGFIKKLNQDFFIENNKIILNPEYLAKHQKSFKKITGSRLAAVLNKNKYNTPFKIWCIMTGIYKDDVDPFLMNVGRIIEPKIIDYINNKLKTNLLTYDPWKIKWDAFQDEKIFGGIPDGEWIDENKQDSVKSIIEIKTTSIDSFQYKWNNNVLYLERDYNGFPVIKQNDGNVEKWFKNNQIIIPDQYIFQLALYMYLKKVNHGIFFICFLKTTDYAQPENFDVNQAWIESYELKLDFNNFKTNIEIAQQWFHDYILTGKSPEMTKDDEQFLMELKNEWYSK